MATPKKRRRTLKKARPATKSAGPSSSARPKPRAASKRRPPSPPPPPPPKKAKKAPPKPKKGGRRPPPPPPPKKPTRAELRAARERSERARAAARARWEREREAKVRAALEAARVRRAQEDLEDAARKKAKRAAAAQQKRVQASLEAGRKKKEAARLAEEARRRGRGKQRSEAAERRAKQKIEAAQRKARERAELEEREKIEREDRERRAAERLRPGSTLGMPELERGIPTPAIDLEALIRNEIDQGDTTAVDPEPSLHDLNTEFRYGSESAVVINMPLTMATIDDIVEVIDGAAMGVVDFPRWLITVCIAFYASEKSGRGIIGSPKAIATTGTPKGPQEGALFVPTSMLSSGEWSRLEQAVEGIANRLLEAAEEIEEDGGETLILVRWARIASYRRKTEQESRAFRTMLRRNRRERARGA